MIMDVSQKLKPETIKKKTGKTLNHWFKVIEKFGANKGHKAIAKHLQDKHKLSVWWAQSLTTRYEFDNDLRQLYQRSGSAGKTISLQRTINASLKKTNDILLDGKQTKKWLSPYLKMNMKEGGKFNFDDVVHGVITKIVPSKYMELELISIENEERSNVRIDLSRKVPRKTLIKITQSGLTTDISINASKDFWGNYLNSLKAYVEAQ